jgi:O-6-methylguanine DNA methyltransferase
MVNAVRKSERLLHWRGPWGALPVLVRNGRIRAISLDPRASLTALDLREPSGRAGPIKSARELEQLMRAALRGSLRMRAILAAIDLTSSTDFERSVLTALAQVRFGETISYGELAAAAGAPRAARAVGAALGKNPIPILLPCHRVVAANGIGGYGGAADRGWRPAGQDPIAFKRALLAREGVLVR